MDLPPPIRASATEARARVRRSAKMLVDFVRAFIMKRI
jgi:hypothetical protein